MEPQVRPPCLWEQRDDPNVRSEIKAKPTAQDGLSCGIVGNHQAIKTVNNPSIFSFGSQCMPHKHWRLQKHARYSPSSKNCQAHWVKTRIRLFRLFIGLQIHDHGSISTDQAPGVRSHFFGNLPFSVVRLSCFLPLEGGFILFAPQNCAEEKSNCDLWGKRPRS